MIFIKFSSIQAQQPRPSEKIQGKKKKKSTTPGVNKMRNLIENETINETHKIPKTKQNTNTHTHPCKRKNFQTKMPNLYIQDKDNPLHPLCMTKLPPPTLYGSLNVLSVNINLEFTSEKIGISL